MSITLLTSVLDELKVPPTSQAEILEIIKHPRRKRRLISRRETLAILGVSAPTLLKYIRRGLIHEYRMSSRKIRFDADEIEALLNGNGLA